MKRWASAVALACFAVGGHVRADTIPRSRVAIVRPPARTAPGGPRRDPALEEATDRLGNELSAAGFEVVIVDAGPEGDARAQVEHGGAASRPFATVAIVETARGATADVWVADHVTGKVLVREMHVSTDAGVADDVAKVLAIRAVELLRASLLEVSTRSPGAAALPPDVARWIADAAPPAPLPRPAIAAPPPAPAPSAASASPAARAPEARRSLLQGVTLGAGVAALASLGDLARGVTPMIRAGFGGAHDFAVRASFYGPGLGRDFSSPQGSATLHEEVATLDAAYGGGARGGFLAPVLSLGAGMYFAQLTGAANVPGYVGRSDQLWSALLDVGVGVAARPTERIAIVLDLHALVEQRRPVVDLGSVEVSRASRPLWLSSLSVMVAP